jgi:hypothetical protein
MQQRVKPVQVIKYSSQTPEKEMDDLVIVEEPLPLELGMVLVIIAYKKTLPLQCVPQGMISN